jgi:hypothetical protein
MLASAYVDASDDLFRCGGVPGTEDRDRARLEARLRHTEADYFPGKEPSPRRYGMCPGPTGSQERHGKEAEQYRDRQTGQSKSLGPGHRRAEAYIGPAVALTHFPSSSGDRTVLGKAQQLVVQRVV